MLKSKKVLKIIVFIVCIFLMCNIVYANNQEENLNKINSEQENINNVELNDSYATKVYIDNPAWYEISSYYLYVKGWAMSESSNVQINVLIDNEIVEQELGRVERPDVLEKIKGYGNESTTPYPGFEATINISKFKDGAHTITVQAIEKTSGQVLGEKVKEFTLEKYKTKVYVDNPTWYELTSSTLYVKGWSMSENDDVKIKVLVDNKIVAEGLERVERSDVLEKIKGYGNKNTTPLPGFETTVDLSSILDGNRTITVQAVDAKTEEVLEEKTKEIIIEKYKTKMYIDNPKVNQICSSYMYISGWSMSDCKNVKINVLVDNKLIEEDVGRVERPDVLEKVTEYGNSQTTPFPGFEINSFIGNFAEGIHTITVQTVDRKTGEIIGEKSKNFTYEKNIAKMYIDNPKINSTCSSVIYVSGWSMSKSKETKINLWVDNTLIEENLFRIPRPDVLEKVTEYGDATTTPFPGYETTIDVGKFVDGRHSLRLETVDSRTGEVLKSVSKEFILKKYNTKGYIESLKNNEQVNDDLEISGWVVSECPNTRIDIYFDNELVKKGAERYERNDIYQSAIGFGDKTTTPLPGYKFNLYIGNYRDGQHTIKINVINESEDCIIESFSKTIEKIPYKSKIYIDTPVRGDTTKGIIDVTGWVMSNNPYVKLRILIDNIVVSENFERHERPDVIGKITGYGDFTTNSLPGYKTIIDINHLYDGEHIITAQAIDARNNKILCEKVKEFYLKKYSTLVNIEFPTDYGVINGDVEYSGWIMSEAANHTLKILLDGKFVTANVVRTKREDVNQAINGYGDTKINPLPGFEYTFNGSELSEGDHIITLEVYTQAGEKIETIDTHIYCSKSDLFGIDVSLYQGDIDWSKVKSSGVKFAIIRAGYRGWGTGAIVEDSKFEQNIKGALTNGIKVGVYFYTQAINENEAIEEANYVISLLKKYGVANKVSYPIAIDSEFVNERARDNNLTVEERTAVCRAFCETIKKAGYNTAIYANKYWLQSKLNMDELAKYNTWLAHYTTNQKPSDYSGAYSIWQYTSSGIISGIDANVDLNISYKNF